MGGLFSLLIGYFVFLISCYYNTNKQEKPNVEARNKRKQYAIKYNRPVWFYRYQKDKKIYLETKTGREVFQGIDVNGLKRWYYSDTQRPMLYSKDERIMNSFNTNKTVALRENKKWCLAEYFWDNSVIDLQDIKIAPYTYLDDYGMDNHLNQRVYLKNMRPYQLYLVGNSKTNTGYLPFINKQYLIRFGNTEYFNFKAQRCISDKMLGSTNVYWTKWYAITEEEYLSLIDFDKQKYCLDRFSIPADLNCLKPINIKDIAFDKGIKDFEWDSVNYGIIRAFDNEGNFIEDI